MTVYLGLCLVGLLLLRWLDFGSSKQPYLRSDVEALARVIRSEIGIGTETQKLHVAWTVRNLARSRGQTIATMACLPCGTQGPARPVSSVQDATAKDRELARRVLVAGEVADPTGGATHFMNPRLQDAFARSERKGYRKQTYNRVRRRWITRYGWEPYYRLGPTLEMWGRKRSSPQAFRRRLR